MKYAIASVKTIIECVTYTIYFICSMFVNLYCKLEYKFVTCCSFHWVLALESRRKGSDAPSLFGSLSG